LNLRLVIGNVKLIPCIWRAEHTGDQPYLYEQLPRRSGEYLFEIIMRRYETKPTIMASNRPLEDWGKLLGDVPSATAILDRFLHHAEIITITGRSYRLKDRAGEGNTQEKKAKKDEDTHDNVRKKGKQG